MITDVSMPRQSEISSDYQESEFIDAISNAKLSSTMDLTSGFNQVVMDEEDRQKTASTTPFGIFLYNRMPLGMTNSPATF